MIAHDTVNQSFPVGSDPAAVGMHLASGLPAQPRLEAETEEN